MKNNFYWVGQGAPVGMSLWYQVDTGPKKFWNHCFNALLVRTNCIHPIYGHLTVQGILLLRIHSAHVTAVLPLLFIQLTYTEFHFCCSFATDLPIPLTSIYHCTGHTNLPPTESSVMEKLNVTYLKHFTK
jgi:hypothetical protein